MRRSPRRAYFPAALIALLAALAVLAAGERPPGDEIVVGGARVRIGTPVVLWTDRGGYDASLRRCFFDRDRVLPSAPAPGCDTPERIGERAAGPITQFVLHFDMAFTSRNCFKVLHDRRGLSVHFLLDLDGTIYQTCDLAARARHARDANDRSVGVEIAHPGCLEDVKGLAGRYVREADGRVRLDLPASYGLRPVRTRGFVARPARPEPVRGAIHGRALTKYDFTDEQYAALARLAAGLSRALPRIRLEAPRGPDGRVLDRAFPGGGAAAAAFEGVVGHYHLQTDKSDPGPAFDWERLLREARAIASR